MPTYDYACKACRHRFERIQGMTEPHVRTCPKCGKRRVERLISGGGPSFKGSGFHHRLPFQGLGRAKADSEASKPKTEAKPEAKPEPKKD